VDDLDTSEVELEDQEALQVEDQEILEGAVMVGRNNSSRYFPENQYN